MIVGYFINSQINQKLIIWHYIHNMKHVKKLIIATLMVINAPNPLPSTPGGLTNEQKAAALLLTMAGRPQPAPAQPGTPNIAAQAEGAPLLRRFFNRAPAQTQPANAQPQAAELRTAQPAPTQAEGQTTVRRMLFRRAQPGTPNIAAQPAPAQAEGPARLKRFFNQPSAQPQPAPSNESYVASLALPEAPLLTQD